MVNEIYKFQKTCKSVESSIKHFSKSEMLKIDYDLDFSNFEEVTSLDNLIAILK